MAVAKLKYTVSSYILCNLEQKVDNVEEPILTDNYGKPSDECEKQQVKRL